MLHEKEKVRGDSGFHGKMTKTKKKLKRAEERAAALIEKCESIIKLSEEVINELKVIF